MHGHFWKRGRCFQFLAPAFLVKLIFGTNLQDSPTQKYHLSAAISCNMPPRRRTAVEFVDVEVYPDCEPPVLFRRIKTRHAQSQISVLLTALTESPPPSINRHYNSSRNLYNNKLWHQLNNSIFAYYHKPDSRTYRLELFNSFIRDFESKLNTLRLVDLVIIVAREINNPKTQVTASGGRAVSATVAHAKLPWEESEDRRKDSDKCAKALEQLPSVENTARHTTILPPTSTERNPNTRRINAMLFSTQLASPSRTPLPLKEKLLRAHGLAMVVLMKEEIYNLANCVYFCRQPFVLVTETFGIPAYVTRLLVDHVYPRHESSQSEFYPGDHSNQSTQWCQMLSEVEKLVG
ncbi:hypothetical protein SISSUDRAFT_1067865 [Sistotremastrum suecicum HHB10207 ss-3]|uniref:PSD13 N-terminal domain-containing protein n=1 Tax=Sistotremastrum suecicum HHB10207 ss-3 TaxID=1314776 RepID=A0A165WLZ4_9AGAM|nr:hypothetical protein SISSUDRAFT_1067865 [Sistotremastrum suecicum HHB10207 ss-3]